MNDVPPLTAPHTARDEAADRGHEPDAVSARIVIVSVTGLVLLLASVLLLTHEILGVLAHEEEVANSQTRVVQQSEITPGPEFTPDQSQQLRELHQSETHRLNTYEWTDEAEGVARIPIDRAMKLLADQGLTTSPPESEQPSDPRTD